MTPTAPTRKRVLGTPATRCPGTHFASVLGDVRGDVGGGGGDGEVCADYRGQGARAPRAGDQG